MSIVNKIQIIINLLEEKGLRNCYCETSETIIKEGIVHISGTFVDENERTAALQSPRTGDTLRMYFRDIDDFNRIFNICIKNRRNE